MRQYRGKRVDTNEWVYGWLVGPFGRAFIIGEFALREPVHYIDKVCIEGLIEVIPESVGQSTGLKDKRLREVYRGDAYESEHGAMIVMWSDIDYRWILKVASDPKREFPLTILNSIDYPYMGTIHDNPELIKE